MQPKSLAASDCRPTAPRRNSAPDVHPAYPPRPSQIPQRYLMGPGPANADPRVLAAQSLPLLGHMCECQCGCLPAVCAACPVWLRLPPLSTPHHPPFNTRPHASTPPRPSLRRCRCRRPALLHTGTLPSSRSWTRSRRACATSSRPTPSTRCAPRVRGTPAWSSASPTWWSPETKCWWAATASG